MTLLIFGRGWPRSNHPDHWPSDFRFEGNSLHGGAGCFGFHRKDKHVPSTP
jgi:hypothetical protein